MKSVLKIFLFALVFAGFAFAEDNDGVLGYENDKRDIASIWGDVGYTYTFVFSNGYFWNLWEL